jgi:hypothetical protein
MRSFERLTDNTAPFRGKSFLMTNNEVPDTTEAAVEAVRGQAFTYRQMGVTPDSVQIARTAITADRKALADAGYVIVKPVKVSVAELAKELGTNRHFVEMIFSELQHRGLPIEVVE